MIDGKGNNAKKLTYLAVTLTILFTIMIVSTNTAGQGYGMSPDVKVINIMFSNDNPLEGEEVNITAVIWSNSTTNVTIIFLCDMSPIGNQTNLTIEAGKNITVNITWKAIRWNHEISVMVNIDNVPLKNSTLSKNISVRAKEIGNIPIVILALFVIVVVIIVIAITPSLYERLSSRHIK
ncbi:MAG: hypothetical protein KJ886_01490 [Candidatus Thermoplasmatota archaeon]|nr:hypothetical protein [Candidatus Thermoplasmatota archaeon]MBU4256327.1 hypothetical protein [Candidatus Thermoplasmatota archaeon]MCG2825796.1 hypothetical protein [Thermoplasmatales archaeon]